MSQNFESLQSLKNVELVTQFLKNCGKIPADKNEFSVDDLNHYPFTRWEKFMFKHLLEMPQQEYEETEFEKIDLKMVLPTGTFKETDCVDSLAYFVCKSFPYLVFRAFPEKMNEKDFLDTSKGSHNEYIIVNDPFFEGMSTYEIAAHVFLSKPGDPEDIEKEFDDDECTVEEVARPQNDTLIFKDGNPYNWMLENLIWASEANENFPMIMANKLPIGRYGKFDFGKKYFWDIDVEKVFYIKDYMMIFPTITQNGKYRTINLKDTKNNYRSISYDKLSAWMKKRGDAYKAKIAENSTQEP